MSAGDIRLTGPQDSGCSVEIWARPGRRWDSATLLAFYTPENPVQLALRQSGPDLLIERTSGRGPYQKRAGAFYVDNVFRSMQPVFVTFTSGAQGTAVYVDGNLVKAVPGFRIKAGDCSGRLVVGTSPMESDSWTGELHGLAVYGRQLTASEVARHYGSWIKEGRPETPAGQDCAALYLFQEHVGDRVHNQIARGVDLVIPEKYVIQDEKFLEPFWKEFDFSWSYARSTIKNIVGFVPLGFFFFAWFSGKTSPSRAAWMVTILGAMVSITIEVLQAYLPTRDSGTTDIITNTLGTWVGVMLYRYLDCREFRFFGFEWKGRKSVRG